MSTKYWLILIFWSFIAIGIYITYFASDQLARIHKITPLAPIGPVINVPSPVPVKPLVNPQYSPTGKFVAQTYFYAADCTTRDRAGQIKVKFTIENDSGCLAKDIKIYVRPYRGAGSPFAGSSVDQVLSDDDPISAEGKWFDIPDLQPGEKYNVTTYMRGHPGYAPGGNPGARIRYDSIQPDGTSVNVITPDTAAVAILKASQSGHHHPKQ